MPKRLRVTRTIVYEGPEEWIDMTLDKSLLGARGLPLDTRTPFAPMDGKSIRCVDEKVEDVE